MLMPTNFGHTSDLVGQEDATDEQDTLLPNKTLGGSEPITDKSVTTESGIMNADRVDRVCALESIVISTAWISNWGYYSTSG